MQTSEQRYRCSYVSYLECLYWLRATEKPLFTLLNSIFTCLPPHFTIKDKRLLQCYNVHNIHDSHLSFRNMQNDKAKNDLKIVLKDHQDYMDVLQSFCKDLKPDMELNSMYLHLVQKLTKYLGVYGVDLYVPFKGDLYSAEQEWKEQNTRLMHEATFVADLEWETLKPFLYKTHSEIAKQLNSVSNEDSPIEININRNTSATFYITKHGDDFKYKGKLIDISKDTDYYKVFCSLYEKLPGGGEISYKELILDLKTRIPKTKSKTDTEVQNLLPQS